MLIWDLPNKVIYFSIICTVLSLSLYESRNTTASMELILYSDDQVSTTKYVRGMYTKAGRLLNVEGNMEQIHPMTLCFDKPALRFGFIYLIKLEPKSLTHRYESFCSSAVEKANIAIQSGATAVVLIVTESEEAMSEITQVIQPLGRPVIVITDREEEEKLYSIFDYQQSLFCRISQVVQTEPGNVIEGSGGLLNKESVTYIGIAVIFGLIVVLVVVAFGIVMKLRHRHRKIQIQKRREKLLERIGTYKYLSKAASNGSGCIFHDTMCPICIEHYKCQEEVRMLPCKHHYHKHCIDKWLMENKTCPCCCRKVEDLMKRHMEINGAGKNNNKEIRGKCKTVSHNYRYRTQGIQASENRVKKFLCEASPSDVLWNQCKHLSKELHYFMLKPNNSASKDIETESVDDAPNAASTSYSTLDDVPDSIPSQNFFISDSFQGGIPQCCSLVELDLSNTLFSGSCNTSMASNDSYLKSKWHSDWNLQDGDQSNISNSLRKSSSDKCIETRTKLGDCNRKQNKRIVRFENPESQIIKSSDDTLSKNVKMSLSLRWNEKFLAEAEIFDLITTQV